MQPIMIHKTVCASEYWVCHFHARVNKLGLIMRLSSLHMHGVLKFEGWENLKIATARFGINGDKWSQPSMLVKQSWRAHRWLQIYMNQTSAKWSHLMLSVMSSVYCYDWQTSVILIWKLVIVQTSNLASFDQIFFFTYDNINLERMIPNV